MKPWDVVHALSVTSSRTEKCRILECVPADSEFWPGAQMALDGMLTFGVKKLPAPETYGPGERFSNFKKLCDDLSSRELTGNAAHASILQFASGCTEAQWTWWYSRILKKNLDCGADKIVSNYAPDEFKVKPFPWQGAVPMSQVPADKIPEDAFEEGKYDGVRTFWFVKPGDPVRVFSRNGKELFNFGSIAASWEKLRDSEEGFPGEGLVIDGEVVSDTFNELMKNVRRKTDAQFKGYLVAFDIIDMETFVSMGPTAPLLERRAVLEEVVAAVRSVDPDCPIVASEYVRVNARRDYDAVMDFYQLKVQQGLEGVIIKDASSAYNYKKDYTWLKLKPTDTWDMEIIGVLPGTGRLIGMAGALVGRVVDGDRVIEANVGSGLDDATRAEIMRNVDSVVGSTMEVMADSVSTNQNGTHSLRFPRFVRFRDDK